MKAQPKPRKYKNEKKKIYKGEITCKTDAKRSAEPGIAQEKQNKEVRNE